MAVAPATFQRQTEILAAGRPTLPVISLDEAASCLAEGGTRHRSVVLTFDDAWADNHAHALEPLMASRLPSTIYVPSQLLGRPGYMTRSQLLEMMAAGCAVGGHTRTHPDLRSCSDGQLEDEIRGGRLDLEDMLSAHVTSFAYPTGLYDARVVSAVGKAGYTTATTVRRGCWRASTPLLLIPRNFVENFSDATFAAAVRGGLSVLRPVEALQARLTSSR